MTARLEFRHLPRGWSEQSPLLGKGGVAAHQLNVPVPLIGADGVVRSTSD
jgi:hypothetical protein